jgi:hypothetical protein
MPAILSHDLDIKNRAAAGVSCMIAAFAAAALIFALIYARRILLSRASPVFGALRRLVRYRT